MEPLIEGCPLLHELKLAGDSWIRRLVLQSIAKHPGIKVFHLGHYEHSDIDCAHVKPKDPILASYSAKGVSVAQLFEDADNFKSLQILYLEKYCELSEFLVEKIGEYRPNFIFKFNQNMSAVTQ